MYGYVVRKGEQPERIAAALGVNYNAMMKANLGGKDARGQVLRQRVVGRDMQTGELIMSFLPADWKAGVVLRIPSGYSGHVGEVPAGMTGAVIDESYGDDPGTKTNCSYADICNPATDCWDEDACKAQGGVPGSNFCNHPNVIKTVQAALGVKADGLWGCISQKALDASGSTYQVLSGGCQSTEPHATGCDGGGPPPVKKKKVGEPCTNGSECETGLCENGKCVDVIVPPKKSETSWLTYLGIGVAIAAGAVGVAYVASDKKKGRTA